MIASNRTRTIAAGWPRSVRVRDLASLAAEVILIAAVAMAAFVALGVAGNPWYRLVTIEGGSMEPGLAPGDLIVVAPVPSRIEPGMILVLTVDGKLVTHRVVAITGDGSFVTRGDANRVDDAWADRDVRVNGRYVATIPLLGHLLPIGAPSDASFTDGVRATMRVTIGPWVTPPTPPECGDDAFTDVLVGTEGDDTFQTSNAGALVFGLGGNDRLTGGNGKDCLVGGDGDDTLRGGNGKDVLLGGEGNDTIYGGDEEDTLAGGNGKDLLDGGEGIDACTGTDRDTLVSCEDGAGAPAEGADASASAPVNGGDPAATPSPSEPGASPSAPPDASATPSATPDPGSTATPAPSPTPTPGASPPLDPTPDPTSHPTPEPTPTAAPTPDPTPAPTPAPTPKPPTADFSFSVAGLTVSFTSEARAADSWSWEFGDGSTSVKRNPDHTYEAAGTYSVTLRVTGSGGEVASASIDVTVGP